MRARSKVRRYMVDRTANLALQGTISRLCMTDQCLVSWAPLGVNVNSAALLTPLVLVQRFWVTDHLSLP